MENDTAGDPMSSLKWSRKSAASLSEELRTKNIVISPRTTGNLLKELEYSLKANRKTVAETQHPDRNQQFEIIASMKRFYKRLGYPIISTDAKKKELIGNFKNPGRKWMKKEKEEKVFAHDFRSTADGIASPYGIYDYIANHGFVVIGTSYDTPEFAVHSIELWLISFGLSLYPNMNHLLLLCDAGGSNGYRSRAWKYWLYTKICQRYGISITVCHYPPGASHWNPADHRLFSFISMNWAGEPLRSYEIMENFIRNTTTKPGLKVNAIISETPFKKGIKITEAQMRNINIRPHELLPQWNYTISP